jgi:hypothetical protein
MSRPVVKVPGEAGRRRVGRGESADANPGGRVGLGESARVGRPGLKPPWREPAGKSQPGP